MAGPVSQWRGERLPKDILQVVGVVRPHPAGVGREEASHAIGLGEKVGVSTTGPFEMIDDVK